MEENGIYQKQCAAQPGLIGPASYIPPTDRDMLRQKKSLLEQELKSVNAAISALDAHPDLEEFTKILQAALR